VLTQGTQLLSFELDAMVLPDHSFIMQGAPAASAPPGMSAGARRGLSGEAMSLPSITGFAYAYWLNPWAPWWSSSEHDHLELP